MFSSTMNSTTSSSIRLSAQLISLSSTTLPPLFQPHHPRLPRHPPPQNHPPLVPPIPKKNVQVSYPQNMHPYPISKVPKTTRTLQRWLIDVGMSVTNISFLRAYGKNSTRVRITLREREQTHKVMHFSFLDG